MGNWNFAMTSSIREQYVSQVGKALAGRLDDEIRAGLNAQLPNGWTMDDIRDRVKIVTFEDEPEWEYYELDGVPMFKIGPVYMASERTENHSYIQTFKRDVIRLAPASGQ